MSCKDHPNFQAITRKRNGYAKPEVVPYSDLTALQKSLYKNKEQIYDHMFRGYLSIPTCIEPEPHEALQALIERLIIEEPTAVRDVWSKASGKVIRDQLTKNAKRYFERLEIPGGKGLIMYTPIWPYSISEGRTTARRSTARKSAPRKSAAKRKSAPRKSAKKRMCECEC